MVTLVWLQVGVDQHVVVEAPLGEKPGSEEFVEFLRKTEEACSTYFRSQTLHG